MKKPFGCILFYCLFFLPFLKATDYPQSPPIDSLSIEFLNLDESNEIRIPLKRVGNLFFIEAKIDTLIGNFILDLGAPYLVLNTTYFRKYVIDKEHFSGTLLSNTDNVKRTTVKRLNIQDINYTNIPADLTDLGSIENLRGIKILGLFGVELFKKYIVDLDVLNKQLVLHKNIDYAKIDNKLILKTDIQLHNNVILLKAKLNNIKLNLSLDTGTERNIIHNKLSTKVYKGMEILRSSTVRDGNGGKTEVLLTVMDNIYIGKTKLKKMRTLILNLNSMSRAYGKKIDGMLGYPFLRSGRVIIDFRKEQLYLYQFKKRE